MKALRYEARVGADGEVLIPRVRLVAGTPVEVILLVRQPEGEELVSASESSLSFWDNPVDDETWNDAIAA